MSTRRQLLLAAGATLIAVRRELRAQQKDKVWRVGFLAALQRPDTLASDAYGEIPRRLSELGYVEGKNLAVEWRFADGNYGRLRDLAIELVRLHADVIVAVDGTPATIAAQSATTTIPIVFINVGDPVGSKLVKSLARPGGNTTGIALLLTETSVKQIEMLVAIVPKLSWLAVLSNSDNPYSSRAVQGLEVAARTLKVSVLSLGARTREDIENAFAVMAKKHVEAFAWIRDSFLTQQRSQIASLAAKHRLPGIGGLAEYAEAGGLMSYGVSRVDGFRRAAAYVDRILKGAKPADLPVEQPTKIEFVINQKTANALGLTIPPELLVLADKVIE